MSRRRRTARYGIATGATAVLLLGLAPLSSASMLVGPASVETSGQSGNHLYSATLTVDVGPVSALVGPPMVDFVVNCQATATPDAAATSITECFEDSPASLPGDFAATATGYEALANDTAQYCVAGFATYLDTITGGFEVSAPRKCITVTLTPLTTTTVRIVGS